MPGVENTDGVSAGLGTVELARLIDDPSPSEIAATIGHLIRTDVLPAGTRLPTVRSLAATLGVSPATVAAAWQTLTRGRMIETHRKKGTFVLAGAAKPRPRRSVRPRNDDGRFALDLANAGPDPDLLPDLAAALAHVAPRLHHNTYQVDPISDELRARVEPRWPFTAEFLMTLSGGFEGIQLLLQTSLRFGDRVLVEEPSAARILDIVESLGLEPIPIACDEHGPRPDRIVAALARRPVALILQPRAQEPCGHALNVERAEQIAASLVGHEMLVIEDDGKGELSTMPPHSVGTFRPEATVRICSYNKSHGLDLRIAVMGGPRRVLQPIWDQRMLGPGWTSHILQAALAFLLDDPDASACLERARATYAERRTSLQQALAERGVATPNFDGVTLWVPVHEERAAVLALNAQGIAVSPGSRFVLTPGSTDHIRLAVSHPLGDIEALADTIAAATTETLSMTGHV